MLLTMPPWSLSRFSLKRYMTMPQASAEYSSNTLGCGARGFGYG